MGQQIQCCAGTRQKNNFTKKKQFHEQSYSCKIIQKLGSIDNSQEYFLQKLEYYDFDKYNQDKIKRMITKELDIDDSDNNPKQLSSIEKVVSPIHKNQSQTRNSLFQFEESFNNNKKIMKSLFDEKESY